MSKREQIISKVRGIMKQAKLEEKPISKKRLIAFLVLDGGTPRAVREIIQTFLDSGELFEYIQDNEVCLNSNDIHSRGYSEI